MFAWIACMFVCLCGFVPIPHNTSGFLHRQDVIIPPAKSGLDGALNSLVAFNIQHFGIRKLAHHHIMLLSIYKYRWTLNFDLIERIETRTSINRTWFIEIDHPESGWTLCLWSWNIERRLFQWLTQSEAIQILFIELLKQKNARAVLEGIGCLHVYILLHFLCMRMYASVYVCMFVCMYANVYVSACMCILIWAFVCLGLYVSDCFLRSMVS